jgi:acyl dehydratase
MIDKSLVGRESEPCVGEVEKGAIRRFAEALGDANPLYHDEGAAKAAGLRGLLAPPTFPITLCWGDQFRQSLDLTYRSLLHGEQHFEYLKPICAGDRISVKSKVADVHDKTGPSGPLAVIVIEDEGRDDQGEPVFRSRKTFLLRRG